jgi:hypothetical protein
MTHVYEFAGKWWFSDETEGEHGPFETEKIARKEYIYDCDHLMGCISPIDWAD